MAPDPQEALARTALLIRLDVFPQVGPTDDALIVDGLRSTNICIVADEVNLSTVAGQTAFVTLVCQVVMLGLRVDLRAPDVAPLAPQPPLRPSQALVTALTAWGEGLFPGALTPTGPPSVTFALGDSPADSGAVRVAGTHDTALLATGATTVPRWKGDLPYVPIAAAAAAAAVAVRAAIPAVATRLRQPVPAGSVWAPSPDPTVHVKVPIPPTIESGRTLDLETLDIISAGAITHATLYTLLRIPGLSVDSRVIEDDTLAVSNANRYALLRPGDIGRYKVDQLKELSTSTVKIRGLQHRLEPTTADETGPLAARVLLGVDDIPTRWYTQELAPGWLGVGATSHDLVLVSGHPAQQPCAGCTHPGPGDNTGDIPTIGFVSLVAGLLLATTLLTDVLDPAAGTSCVEAYPLGFHQPRGIRHYTQRRHPGCPVCGAVEHAA